MHVEQREEYSILPLGTEEKGGFCMRTSAPLSYPGERSRTRPVAPAGFSFLFSLSEGKKTSLPAKSYAAMFQSNVHTELK